MICEIAQLQTTKLELAFDDITECFYLPVDKACDFDFSVPDGYEFRSLELNDVDSINSLWPHRFPGSEIYLRNLIRNNLTLGIINVVDDELLAWIMWYF
jgi:hypothetical protein